MKKDDIEPFLKNYVKIVQRNGFVLDGTIDKVTEETIVFTTKQATSVIDIKAITSIVFKRRGGY
ncbi:MAG: hypothetical protein KAJ44_00470 [Thermoplasmatales archaeon]|nr:hypothetical protein [Thermoplasmatales archaeon]